MSCLPFATWAAKKAAQLVGESGGGSGGSGVKKIDLATVLDGNFNTTLLVLFQLGGGTLEPGDNPEFTAFFEEFNCEEQLEISFQATFDGRNYRTVTTQNIQRVMSATTKQLYQVSFSVRVAVFTMVYDISVFFTKTSVSLTLATTEIPTTT